MSSKQRRYLFIKRILDFLFSIFLIFLTLPLLLLIGILIKITSKGPVFFIQWRVGKNKKPFRIIKFRTMKKGSPETPSNELSKEDLGKMYTKFGKLLRKSSLDELPQIFNIFVGQMSFIGPRPGALKNEEYLIFEREKYEPSPFEVLPGLSGYAQTFSRFLDSPSKAKLDHFYVSNISFFFDIKIFFLTIKKLFKFEGS